MMIKERSSVKVQRERGRWRWIWSMNPCRSKLIVAFVMLICTLLVTSKSLAGSRLLNEQQAAMLLPSSRHRYTVLINTWKRHELLKKSVAHYVSCGGVDAIRIVWSEPELPSEALQSTLNRYVQEGETGPQHVQLRFDLNEEDDLNNRFKPLEGVETDAILSIDDDVLVPCSNLEFAFRMWRSAPDNMVGFVPRMHWIQNECTHPETYTYGGWWSIWWTGSYSMVLTKAAFLHHKYFVHYSLRMPRSIREYVKKERNCEDIAMSFLVANLTEAPPLWVKGRIDEIGSTGISSLKGHNQKRSVCLNYLASFYGHMPLVSTNVKAVDAQSEWLW